MHLLNNMLISYIIISTPSSACPVSERSSLSYSLTTVHPRFKIPAHIYKESTVEIRF